jgi:hypothetical protein
MFCAADSTALLSWKRVFYRLREKTFASNLNLIDKKLVEEDNMIRFGYNSSQFDSNEFIKVLVVRHPLDRILSIYLEHFENPKRYDKGFHDKFDYWIKFLNRNDTMDTKTWNRNITFEEFVKFIANTDESRFHYNTLWDGIYELCMPCSINYDIIIRYENLLEDSNFVLDAVGLNHIITFPKEDEYITNSIRFKRYYEKLAPNILQKLVNAYRRDFLLFGYSTTF